MILLHKNCENCGSPLKLNKETMICKCNYCDTEYYVKQGFDNEYWLVGQKITLNIRGVKKEFYISEERFEPIDYCSYRDITGQMIHTRPTYKEEITLIEI